MGVGGARGAERWGGRIGTGMIAKMGVGCFGGKVFGCRRGGGGCRGEMAGMEGGEVGRCGGGRRRWVVFIDDCAGSESGWSVTEKCK